ncbi:hypothetical protein [Ruegeria sp.]|uniref:hypothetical protein n=1 Tax=Ruegeria sp. TaxID=1879320 RepID=UPI003C7E9B3A
MSKVSDEEVERLKAAMGEALGETFARDGPPLPGEAAKKAVMIRATELTQTGIPFDRAIRQAKLEFGL